MWAPSVTMTSQFAALEHFVAEAPSAMAMFDREMRYVAASPKWLAAARLKQTPVGRSPYADFPEMSDAWKASHRRCLAGAIESFEAERPPRSGGPAQRVRWEARPWRDGHGAIGGIVISGADVAVPVEAQETADDLKRRLAAAVEEASHNARRAQEAERRLNDALDAIPGGLVVFDADDRLVVCNKATRDMYPSIADELRPGATFEHLLRVAYDHGAYDRSVADKESWVRMGLERRRKSGGAVEQLTSLGRWLRIEERGLPDGGLVALRTDITDLQNGKLELARKTALLEAALENIGEGIAVVGPNLELLTSNEIAAQLLETPAALLQPGASFEEVIRFRAARGDYGGVDPEAWVRQRVAEFRAQKPWSRTRSIRAGRVIEARFHPLPDGGGIYVFRDVTQLADQAMKLAEALREAEQASRAKSEFLAMASHELRTPMNAIIGMSSLLIERTHDRTQRHYASAIEVAAENLLVIIDDLLEFASLDAGRAVPDKAPFDLRAIAASAIETARNAAESQNLAIGAVIDPDVPADLEGDGGRIRRILVNLLDNAVKHTAQGSVTVRAHAKPAAGAGAVTLRFEVEDTGAGFPPSEARRLFEPFERAATADRVRAAGLGLGLAISHRLVDLLGGTIGAESEPGAGSRFWFEIPVRAAAPSRSKAQASPEAAHAFRPLRILVAEDMEANREIMGAMLEKLGHEAYFAHDGAQAIEAAVKRPYDAILMDIQMPNVDGLEATRTIRRFGGRLATIPIIAVSAFYQSTHKDAAMAAGASGFLSKPVRRSVLEGALKAISLSEHATDEPPAAQRDALRLSYVHSASENAGARR